MTRARWGVGAAACLLALGLANPAPAQMWYLGGEGGWTDLESQKGHTTLPAGSPLLPGGGTLTTHSTWNGGFNVGVRGGLQWGPWQFEEEFRYQRNGLDGLSLGAAKLTNVHGDREAYALMSNVIYGFDYGWRIVPHLGFGVGAVDLRTSESQSPGLGTIASGDDWEFGYQGIGGIRYNISPSLAFDLDYRYLATLGADFKNGSGGKSTSGYQTHNLVASLSFYFGVAPPPPPSVVMPAAPPAPPPAAAPRVFLVFFDWDRDTITPEGMQILQKAADAWHSGAPVQVQIVGYTDRSGSPGYNQRLSERRAANVAKALVALGIPREQMAVSGRGENDNRVPTADGVREPQNRRVEITLP
ncbi:MAG TPA: OmpA family protein [Stellaceae bacterium]|nr:OmpA family protein [Stellaceae bacterium]